MGWGVWVAGGGGGLRVDMGKGGRAAGGTFCPCKE